MTRDEILNMPAGREVDVLIAEKVMGWKWDTYFLNGVETLGLFGPEGLRCVNDYPEYSKGVAAAWEVEERIYNLGQVMNVVMQRSYCFALIDVITFDTGYSNMASEVHASPHQRCRAALLAVMEEK